MANIYFNKVNKNVYYTKTVFHFHKKKTKLLSEQPNNNNYYYKIYRFNFNFIHST